MHRREAEAFASGRSLLKTVGQQPDLTASHPKSVYSINAARHRGDPPPQQFLDQQIRLFCIHLELIVTGYLESMEEHSSKTEPNQGEPGLAEVCTMAAEALVKLNKPIVEGEKCRSFEKGSNQPPTRRVKTSQTKSPRTNPAQRWNKIIFRQVNKGKRKNKYSTCLTVLTGSI